ncbi:zinc finger protein 34-like isoform X2 [Condylostylus longicornis]|uniref:zinc finger protein 34-like isoform X2 n=1 Tax=Condylostylus longicornis TaxID=2530218 RepID=UPI00244DC0AE|nr:zinc finger protein 34-like isoform X2 [Condylostylus longicornis]
MKIASNTCRLCVQIFEDSSLESVFEKDDEVEIAKKVFDISGVFIEKNEKSLPEKICKHCKSTLQLSYEFRIICQQSDNKLRALLSAPEEIENKLIKYEVSSDNESNFLDVSCHIEDWQEDLSNFDSKNNIQIEKREQLDTIKDEENEATISETATSKISLKKGNTKKEIDDDSFKKGNRRFCTFKRKWIEKYDWIRAAKDDKNAFCTVCNCEFSIAYGGESVVSRHMTRNKHLFNANPELKKDKVFRGNGVKCSQKSEELTFIMCEVCGNKYPTKRHLKRHLKYHSDVMDYECEICKKQFREMMQLKRHMRTHTGERPYPCHYCDKRFGDYSTRIKHERFPRCSVKLTTTFLITTR